MSKEVDIMPKLLIINVTCNQGSTGKIAEQVGVMMKDCGWDVYYAHGARRVNQSRLKTIPFSSVKDEYLHALKSLLFDADGLGSKQATRRLVKIIQEIKPDIIHLHNIHGYYLNYKILFGYLNTTNIKIVMTLHDCWLFTGHCVHFVTVNCMRWKTGCFACPLRYAGYKKSLIDRSAKNYVLKKAYIAGNRNLTLVPVSNWLGRLLKESFYKQHDIKVIQNGVDVNVFRPFQPSYCSQFRIIGVSNVWSKDKGLYDIFELRKYLDINQYRITLVGLSKGQIENLPAGISGIERANNQGELAHLYANADVLINPTYADTFPTVNLEALACGTPVVTYKTGGSPESLSVDTGVILEQGDVKGMAHAIEKMRNRPLSSKKCRDRILQMFNKDVRFQGYKELFERLLGS